MFSLIPDSTAAEGTASTEGTEGFPFIQVRISCYIFCAETDLIIGSRNMKWNKAENMVGILKKYILLQPFRTDIPLTPLAPARHSLLFSLLSFN